MKRILLSVPALMLAGNALGSVTMEISKPVDRPEKQAGEIQVIGHTFTADFGENRYSLYFPSETRMEITVEKGMGKNQVVDIERVRLGRDLYMVTWQETDRPTVTHLEDLGKGMVHPNTTLPYMPSQNYKGT